MISLIPFLAASLFVSKAEGLTSKNALSLMSPGINLGNTLEAIPKETSWGNPLPTDAYFRGLKQAGFRSVRIPIAWTQYSDEKNNISAEWMAHVTDVVKMARRAGLYIVLNVHWDGGWLQPTYAKREVATAKLRKFWTQIATNFADFDDHVLFAGTNETGVEGVYGMPKPENAEVQNAFLQAFVGTVRSTGGKNRERMLVVQGYNTDIDATVAVNLQLPVDSAKGKLMMEVHFYSPFDFTLNDKSDIWQWGKGATDPKAVETWANEEYIDKEFEKMKAAFVDKGVPVVLGEYCAGMKRRFPEMNRYRLAWDQFVTESAIKHGMIPMLWDTGSTVDRITGKPLDEKLIRVLIPSR